MSADVFGWLLWGLGLVLVGFVWFGYREIKKYRQGEKTLSEVVENAIAWSRPLKWTLLAAMIVLCIGWPLVTIHWYTDAF